MATEQLLKYSRKPVLNINIYIFRDASYDPEENCIWNCFLAFLIWIEVCVSKTLIDIS
jgi:hypothetical protein